MKKITLEGIGEEIYVHKNESSGLVTYMWVNKKVNTCYFSLNVKYGSIHTKFKIDNKVYEVPNGIAHFIEHIKFNEKKDKSSHEDFYKYGADANAFTTFKYTSYIVYASGYLKENLNKLLDFVYNPYFTKKTVSQEKGIIIEEANMLEDNPLGESYFQFLENIFSKSNYRNFITGRKEDIKKITLEDILIVYNNFYHPHNMFLCITGNFNPYEMAKVIDENMDKKEFAPFKKIEVTTSGKESNFVNCKYKIIKKNVISPKVRFGIKVPIKNLKNYNVEILQIIVGLIMSSNIGSTSDFKEKIIEDEVATYFSHSIDVYDDYMVISVIADTEYPNELVDRLNYKFQHLEIKEKDIIRKKRAAIASFILSYDDIENVAHIIEEDIILYGRIIPYAKELLEKISLDMVRDVFKKLDLTQKTVLIIEKDDVKIKKAND